MLPVRNFRTLSYCGVSNLDGSVGFYGGDTFTELEFDLSAMFRRLIPSGSDYIAPGGKWGINAPASVELSFSTDGVNFSGYGSFRRLSTTRQMPLKPTGTNVVLKLILVALTLNMSEQTSPTMALSSSFQKFSSWKKIEAVAQYCWRRKQRRQSRWFRRHDPCW